MNSKELQIIKNAHQSIGNSLKGIVEIVEILKFSGQDVSKIYIIIGMLIDSLRDNVNKLPKKVKK